MGSTDGRPMGGSLSRVDRAIGHVNSAWDRSVPVLIAVWKRCLPVLRVVRPLGWVVVAIAVFSWLIGTVLGWIEATTVSAVAGILVLFCAAFLIGRSSLTVAIDLRPTRVTVGERAMGQITAANESTTRLLPIRIDLVVGNALASFDIPSLGGGDHHEELFQVATERRGVIPVGPARVVRADPLGLFARVVQQSTATELFVHPKTVRVPGAGAGFLRDLEGRESADMSPSDLAFHSLREYVPGDDRRHVHWKTSARSGRLMVQQFVDTRRSHVLVILDDDEGSYSDPAVFEVAVSVVASLGVRAVIDDQVRTVVATERALPTRTRTTLLDALSRVDMVGQPGALSRNAVVASRSAPDASIVVLVTGASTPIPVIRRLARRFTVDTRFVGIRVGASEAGMQAIENIMVLDLATLNDLPRTVSVAVGV